MSDCFKLETENFKFNQHRKCEFFPCHETKHPEDFNCLFCWCPLYVLGDKCGGNFVWRDGVKDCGNCMIPHKRGNYDYICEKFDLIRELVSQNSDIPNENEVE